MQKTWFGTKQVWLLNQASLAYQAFTTRQDRAETLQLQKTIVQRGSDEGCNL